MFQLLHIHTSTKPYTKEKPEVANQLQNTVQVQDPPKVSISENSNKETHFCHSEMESITLHSSRGIMFSAQKISGSGEAVQSEDKQLLPTSVGQQQHTSGCLVLPVFSYALQNSLLSSLKANHAL